MDRLFMEYAGLYQKTTRGDLVGAQVAPFPGEDDIRAVIFERSHRDAMKHMLAKQLA